MAFTRQITLGFVISDFDFVGIDTSIGEKTQNYVNRVFDHVTVGGANECP